MTNESSLKPRPSDANIGGRIMQFVDDNKLSSIRVRPGHIGRLDRVDSVIIVGSSGVGKTTLGGKLMDGFRNASEDVSFPERVTTRAARKDDDPSEGFSCSRDEFERLVDEDTFAMHWVRRDNPDRYGMLQPDGETFPIFVTASAVVNNNSLQPKEILDTALLVAIYAPDRIKNERIVQRSSDIDATDLGHRFRDRAIGIYPKVDMLVKNFGENESNSANDLLEVTRFVVQNRTG